ncbi:MAG: histidine kinase [Prevotella ruminicola]|uniref:histidine kinase n=1 Tax=Xylanibacter ruminicola TaxID=839 RepID=A0A9D5S6T6_XYLRU|nr:histidine kinase [Xylanibacter ruminicola]
MRLLWDRISGKLSLKLSLGILMFLVVVFMVSLGILFTYARQMVKTQALERAELELSNTTQHVNELMNEVETSTRTAVWHLGESRLTPEWLLNYVRLVAVKNPDFDGCSVALEPNFFPQRRHFSVYAYNDKDTTVAKIEPPYDYFGKPWYKKSAELRQACWVEAYLEDVNGVETENYSDMVVSYSMPMFNQKKELVGVIATDLSMPWLSDVISKYKPYINSYTIMLGPEGQYFVHPDSTRLVKHTIFSDADPVTQQDMIALGREMVAGHKGMMKVKVNGEPCIVLYQSLTKAPWSMALICRESDLFAGYNKLLYILIPVLTFGLLLILVFCLNVISVMVEPLNKLTRKLSYITNGHFNEPIEFSTRKDVIGRLQNNFAEMQQALSSHIYNLNEINAQTEMMNHELEKASEEVQRADEKKNDFVQDLTHQIRTPLNIINGFTQVLRDDYASIPPEEIDDITETMQTNAVHISRMMSMLAVASNAGKDVKVNLKERVNLKELIDHVAMVYATRPPHTVELTTEVGVSDTHTVKTNRDFLTKALNELLFNAKKFTTEGHVKLSIKTDGLKVLFIVEDTGPGISADMRAKLFSNFEKGDILSEGLGLGLPVCRQLVRLIGGELKLDKSYTNGSRFIIVIPDEDAWVDLR